MKRMSEVFELPIDGYDLKQTMIQATQAEGNSIAHAINHADALADALAVMIQNNWHTAHIRREAQKIAEEALAAYRGKR